MYHFTPPNNCKIDCKLKGFVYKVADLWPFFVIFFILVDPGAIRGLAAGKFGYTVASLSIGVLISSLATVICAFIGRRWPQVLFLLLATPLYVFYVFVWSEFGLIISPETLSLILETDKGEATEFFNTFFQGKGAIMSIGSVIWLWTAYFFLEYWRAHDHMFLSKKMLRIFECCKYPFVCVCAALSLYGVTETVRFSAIYKARDFAGIEDFINENNDRFGHAYSDLVSSLLYSFRYLDVISGEFAVWERMNGELSHEVLPCSADSLDVVFVIGESFIRDHGSVYGYALPTTPAMQREADSGHLAVYTDMVSRATMTTVVLRSLLTANDNRGGRGWNRSPYVPLLFRCAGFGVMLFENQQQFGGKTSPFNTGLNVFLFNDVLRDKCYTYVNPQEYIYDGGLVDELSSMHLPDGNNLYIFHLMGQHVKASSRYPRDGWEAPFSVADISAFRKEPWLDEAMLQEIADYDNATAYNDYVLGRLYDVFRERKAVIVYLSDHGEEVYDYRPLLGRKAAPCDQEWQRAYYQNSVPCTVWWSERFASGNPGVVEALRSSVNRRGMSDDIYNLLLSLGGIGTSWYDAERDIHSAEYVVPERIISPSGLNYDDLVRSRVQLPGKNP